MGTLYSTATKTCGACTLNYECLNNTKQICPVGTLYDSTKARCLECTDDHIGVYSSAAVDLAPGRFCYGKDPTMTNTLILFLNADRQSYYNY